MHIVIKRVYEPAAPHDGFRVLVDRLWPRGLSKERARVDLWLKDIAPSNELRRWFNHEEAKWLEFQRRYKEELDAAPDAVRALREAAKGRDTLTLLYGARNERHNQALVLQQYLSGSNA